MLRTPPGQPAQEAPAPLRRTAVRRTLGALVALAASVATLVTAAPPATASSHTHSGRCPEGSLCLFDGGAFKGELKILSTSHAGMGRFDNKTSSLENNGPLWGMAYTGPGYTGDDTLVISPENGTVDLSTGFAGGVFNNSISSIKLATTRYELENDVPWMDWYRGPEGKRPAGLPRANQFGDMNHDGHPDLLERADDGRLWFLSGTGAQGKLVGTGWNGMTQLLRHGDYTGDGKEDLLARDKTGVLWTYPGRGDGTLGTRVRVGGGWNGMRDLAAAGDLTGDGRADLLAVDTAGTLWTYPGNGQGIFGVRQKVGGGWNAMNELAAPGDMNGDGRADLLARDGARALWLYPGNGKGTFGVRKQLPLSWRNDGPLVTTGDVNGDGLSDLIRPAGQQVYVHHGDGTGSVGRANADMSWDGAPNVRIF
ncbi:FG-GAP-like repeat-containing protein [Streptomyces sp. NPDC047315]|uniref:FG-GAP-like repeat-containing protein n=1 Tax=Streptomyces sp. NPDC047315 TaxID=3155142 RepID=UPI0033E35E65